MREAKGRIVRVRYKTRSDGRGAVEVGGGGGGDCRRRRCRGIRYLAGESSLYARAGNARVSRIGIPTPFSEFARASIYTLRKRMPSGEISHRQNFNERRPIKSASS